MAKPFRWQVARRERLGRLLDGERAPAYPELIDDLLGCCARVIAHAGDADLVFVGRSPESIFDLGSGLLADTAWAPRLQLLNVSLRRGGAIDDPPLRAALREQLADVGLAPPALARAPRPIALVDLVYEGHTFAALADTLTRWADETGQTRPLRRRVRWVGITMAGKTSPKAWRWHQQASWTSGFPRTAFCNVAIDGRLWRYLGNTQLKVTRTHPRDRWLDPSQAAPPRDAASLAALRLAWDLFTAGSSSPHRLELARRLVANDRMRTRWLRQLVLELRGR